MLPQHQQDTCERQDLYIEPNACFSDLSDSLNSISLEFSLNGTGQNHLCMNWSKFTDHVCYLCLGVSVVPLWLAAQEVVSSNSF